MSAHQLAKKSVGLANGWTRLTMSEVGRWFGGDNPSEPHQLFGEQPPELPDELKEALAA